jgi:hypothetical protein
MPTIYFSWPLWDWSLYFRTIAYRLCENSHERTEGAIGPLRFYWDVWV